MGSNQRNGARDTNGAMSKKRYLLGLVMVLPLLVLAQAPSAPFNPPTLAVLEVNRPAHIEKATWLAMMQDPVHRSLYPLRVTQAMLDTLDGRLLDNRFRYELVREVRPPTTRP